MKPRTLLHWHSLSEGSWQLVPSGHWAHAVRVPLQSPVCPQVVLGCWSHSLRGSVPARAGPQLPLPTPLCFWLARQVSHVSLHASSQQTPSTQKPESHAVATE